MFDFVPKETIYPREEMIRIQTKVFDIIRTRKKSREKPEALHHYTSAEGFKGIIESGVLHATHVSFMNDLTEYLHAVSLLSEAIKNEKKSVSVLRAAYISR